MLLQTLLFASTVSATCLHNLAKFKRAEGEVPIGKFGYTGTVGPLNWAALAPENEACKTGSTQSPINIDDSIQTATEKPKLDIPEQKVEFENLGTTIEVIVNGTTTFAGADFRLKQFHMHTPSEHRIGEEYFPLEIHMVHEGVADKSQLAVISVLFDLSEETPSDLLKALQPSLAAIQTPGTKTEIESLPFEALIEHVQTTDLFQYTGSLTTPPCAEGLTFLVTKQPLKVDVSTFNEIKKIVKFNSRYTQNTLGEENLIMVAGKAGTAEQVEPGNNGTAGNGTFTAPAHSSKAEAVATSTATTLEAITVIAGAPTKGHVMTVTEIQGQPTHVLGVVQRRHR